MILSQSTAVVTAVTTAAIIIIIINYNDKENKSNVLYTT
jgi:hypothetical protein